MSRSPSASVELLFSRCLFRILGSFVSRLRKASVPRRKLSDSIRFAFERRERERERWGTASIYRSQSRGWARRNGRRRSSRVPHIVEKKKRPRELLQHPQTRRRRRNWKNSCTGRNLYVGNKGWPPRRSRSGSARSNWKSLLHQADEKGLPLKTILADIVTIGGVCTENRDRCWRPNLQSILEEVSELSRTP
ncbi:unnamed protein product [Musa acuminata var. zebrina]